MNASQELQQLSTLDTLQCHSTDDLLAAFIQSYNHDNAEWDQLVSDNEKLAQQLDGYKRQAHSQRLELESLTKENDRCRELALQAEDVAKGSMAVTAERDRLKIQLRSLQQEFTKLKGGGDPKRLKEQVVRLKSKSQEREKRITSLELGIKNEQRKRETTQVNLNKALNKIAELDKQLAHDTGSGLYHNGEHHLIIWPQKTKMLDEHGHTFEGRSLLYLHQSGRGGLMTYNPQSQQVNLGAAPRGGLRPTNELKEFAQDWLFKVNALQDGIVKDDDMIPVNYNSEF